MRSGVLTSISSRQRRIGLSTPSVNNLLKVITPQRSWTGGGGGGGLEPATSELLVRDFTTTQASQY